MLGISCHSTLAVIKINTKTFGNQVYLAIFVSSYNTRYMGYNTKIQLIKRQKSEQWYVNFPSAVAQAIEFEQGEIVEWIIDDFQHLVLKRSDVAVAKVKKKLKKPTTA